MPYWTTPTLNRDHIIPTDHPEIRHVGSSGGALAWPEANLAIAIPWLVTRPVTVKRMTVLIGGAASGNMDLGIYGYDLKKIVSTGSTAMAGTNVVQIVDVTDTFIQPGRYYMAIAIDNTTGQVFRISTVALIQRTFGVFQMSTAFALPATLVPATLTNDLWPLIGVETGRIL